MIITIGKGMSGQLRTNLLGLFGGIMRILERLCLLKQTASLLD